ncbi:hypothetical protein THIOKS13320014 [Thiocapsa sp. KS1]|nr:hypothetical protein THIOKS13320014 [Thiocapsa sp. KS1]
MAVRFYFHCYTASVCVAYCALCPLWYCLERV